MIAFFVALLCFPSLHSSISAVQEPHFTKVGVLNAIGGPSDIQLAVKDSQGNPRFFVGFTYNGGFADLVEFLPNEPTVHSRVHPLPRNIGVAAPGLQTISSIVKGPDGALYLSVLPGGKILRYDLNSESFSVIGGDSLPSINGSAYPWQLLVGKDGQIYGCSYPDATLFRVDLATQTLHILSRMRLDCNSGSEYARFMVTGPDGTIYLRTGIDLNSAKLFGYSIDSHSLPFEIQLPGHLRAKVLVQQFYYSDKGTRVFAKVQFKDINHPNSSPTTMLIELKGGKATQVTNLPNSAIDMFLNAAILPDLGSFTLVSPGDRTFKWTSKTTGPRTYPFDYQGQPVQPYRLGLGPDNEIYITGKMPIWVFQFDPDKSSYLGTIADGQVYGIYPFAKKVLFATYGAPQALATFDPYESITTRKFRFLDTPNATIPTSWRPISSAVVSDGSHFWIGSTPPYERVNGTLVQIDKADMSVFASIPVPERTISSLACLSNSQAGGPAVLALGTSLETGAGNTESKNGESLLYLWSTVTKQIVGNPIQPIPGCLADCIFDLCALPNNELFGIARLKGTPGHQILYAFVAKVNSSANSLVIERTRLLDTLQIVPELTYNAIEYADNLLLGLHYHGVFTIEPNSLSLKDYRYDGNPVTAGWAKRGKGYYFSSGVDIVRFGFSDND